MSTIKYEIPTFHWYFQPNFITRNKWLKKFFYNPICFIINHDFYVITFWMHYTFSIVIFRRHKINCYLWLDFSGIIFFEIIMTYFKCSLILLRYSSNDGVLFLLPLLHIQYNCYFKNHLLLLLCNHFLFLHSQITLSLIASFSFFSLKRCLISLIAVSFISFCSLKRFRTSLFCYFLFFIFIMP